MLAARDQENLLHEQQTTAAGKPLNQALRQLPPKTPGYKPSKTPFKLPLNDENGLGGFGFGGKGLKTTGKGNENVVIGGRKLGQGDKNVFVTPLAPRNRAPLGDKTTNAKAKAFQTPGPPVIANDVVKHDQKATTARKAKPRVSHAEMIKLEILGDKDELEEREIEYMPPKPKDLPSYPDDDLPDLDLSIFKDGFLTRDYMSHYLHQVDDHDGMSFVQRRAKKEQEEDERAEKLMDAKLLRNIESANIPCIHDPECPGEDCKDSIESKRLAYEKWEKIVAEIEGELVSAPNKHSVISKAPSTLRSKDAAVALSQGPPKPKTSTIKTNPSMTSTKSRLAPSMLSRGKRTPPPTNPSPMRHTAATAASRTTLGYSKGRTASATIRKTVLPKQDNCVQEAPDTTLAPALYIKRYGEPAYGSPMWFRCKSAGCFDHDDGDLEDALLGRLPHDLLVEEAERDFELTW